MKNSFLPLLSLMLLGAACTPSPEKKVEVLQQEVLALHDSAMAKMGTLRTSQKKLTYLKDSVVVKDAAAQENLSKGISDLGQADEKMWQWMRAYKNPEGKKPQEALHYLQQEKEKVEQVRLGINESLRTADSLNSLYRTDQK